MRRSALLFWMLFSITTMTLGHNLKGHIKDKGGLPIPFATVFFKEASQGTTTNEKGDFEIMLPTGRYTVTYRSLGFVPKTEQITLTSQPISLSIVLEEQFQEIQEVSISAGIDRALPIMRKVISLSYVHLNQVKSYGATAYLRGTLKVEHIPGIFRNQLKKQHIDIQSGDILVQESVNQITFTAPEKYDLQIKSINSSFPKGIDFQVTDILGSSLYQDNINVLISPVGKNAFAHYNFTYEGFSYEGKNIVNKIKVTPKRKSKLLFEGTLYIMETYWCIKEANLNFETPIGTVNLLETFDEVSPAIWLPVSHQFSFDASMMGLKGNGKFSTSMRYTDLQFNESVVNMLNLPGRTADNPSGGKAITEPKKPISKPSRIQEKRREKIDQLMEKKELNNREMNKLSRMMQRNDNKQTTDSVHPLEIAESVKVRIDEKATNRDTAFWNSLRPIPLAEEELKSFAKRDSAVMAEQNRPKMVSIAKRKFNAGIFEPLFLGKTKSFRDTSWHFSYFGLLNLRRITFNAVDGFTLSQEMLFTKKYSPGKSLEIRPRIAYAFSRQVVMGNLGLKYQYAPMHRATFELNGGSYSTDFNDPREAISPLINSVASLFFKTNFARFYDNRYLRMANSIDLANGLALQTTVEWRQLRQLDNATNYSFIDKKDDYQPNLPANKEVTAAQLADQTGAKVGVRLEYTPRYYYKIRNGIKVMSNSYFPTLYLGYEKGIKNLFSSTADFDLLQAGLTHAIEFSQSSSLAWDFNAGWFKNNHQLHFSDFAHAMTQTSPVLPHEYRHSFYVPNYYALSTADRFIHGFISYKSPFILLKYLPVLSNTLWREMIWAGYYSSPANPYHTEIGYTILEFLYSTNVGIYAGFDKFTFTKFGINLAFRISY